MKITTLMLALTLGIPCFGISAPAGASEKVNRTVQQDPADSLYRLGTRAMRSGNYDRAAEIFHRLNQRYPSSSYAEKAYYFEAYSLYRGGETKDLRSALTVLADYQQKFPSVFGRGDATTLRIRVCQALAQRGDEACAVMITAKAGSISVASGRASSSGPGANESSGFPGGQSGYRYGVGTSGRACAGQDDENDERIAALNALLQMDAERAMPILKKVLNRQDTCSAALREQAVFLVSQKHTAESADILLASARNDPDPGVREKAVFWLSQVRDDRAIDMLNDILKSSRDQDIREKALFSLSQHSSAKGNQILRDFAMNESQNSDLREKAIFWLGQRRSPENADFLRKLYFNLRDNDLKEKILFSLSQQRGSGNDQWLIDIVRNAGEDEDLRKKALFYAGKGGAGIDQIIAMYSSLPERDLREQVIFVLAKRREKAAVSKLLDIAKTEKDAELRKKAIFWLSQSRDPRVQDFLLELINR